VAYYNNMDTIIGNCTGNGNPDAWFPEFAGGTVPRSRVDEVVYQVNYALSECATCPAKDRCLDDGMRPENLAHGIWGGLLAAERLAIVGHNPDEFYDGSAEKIAFNMLRRIEPLLRR